MHHILAYQPSHTIILADDSGTGYPMSPLPTVLYAHQSPMTTITESGHTVPNRTHYPLSRLPTMCELYKQVVHTPISIKQTLHSIQTNSN